MVQNCAIIPQIIHQITQYALEFLPIQLFSSITLKNPCFSAAAKFTVTDEMTRVISARDRLKWGTFGPLYLLNRHGHPYFFTVFSKHILVGNMQENLKKKKKSSITFFFSEE